MRTEGKQEVRSATTTQRAEAPVSDAPLKRAPRLSLPESCGSTADYIWYQNTDSRRGIEPNGQTPRGSL
jgi:hypothetical protein